MRTVSHIPSTLRRPRLPAESGFTLVEVLFAMIILVGLATAMAGLLTSSITSNALARHKTVAEQAATQQIEYVRRLAYDDVGIVLGNPPGVIPAITAISVNGFNATLVTRVRYVDDPTPTSYETSANYKRVSVTVTRSDGKTMAQQVTYVAPSSRTPFGGLNLAIIQPLVIDYGLNVPVEDVNVSLATGPSAPRNDATDATGKVKFAKLTPNPTASCPSDCYDLTATKLGYVQLGAPFRVNVAAGQTATPTLQIYRPATINLVLRNSSGGSYTGTASVKITSGRTGASQTFTVSGGSATITAVNGEQIVPTVQYTAEAWTSGTPLCSTPVSQYVPDDYPTVLTSTFTLTLGACPSGSADVTVTWGGSAAPGATVTLSGGPYALAPVTGTTDSAGQVTFTNVPGGGGYTVQATKAGQNAPSRTISVAVGSTTSVAMALPTGTVDVNVRRSGSNVSGATVVLSGGPNGVGVTGTTNAGGNVTFTNVPVGSGYTIKAWSCASGAPRRSGSVTGVTTTSGTTSVTVSFDTSNVCPLP